MTISENLFTDYTNYNHFINLSVSVKGNKFEIGLTEKQKISTVTEADIALNSLEETFKSYNTATPILINRQVKEIGNIINNLTHLKKQFQEQDLEDKGKKIDKIISNIKDIYQKLEKAKKLSTQRPPILNHQAFNLNKQNSNSSEESASEPNDSRSSSQENIRVIPFSPVISQYSSLALSAPNLLQLKEELNKHLPLARVVKRQASFTENTKILQTSENSFNQPPVHVKTKSPLKRFFHKLLSPKKSEKIESTENLENLNLTFSFNERISYFIQWLSERSQIQTEGLFRISSTPEEIKQFTKIKNKDAFHVLIKNSVDSAHIVANALKSLFKQRQLFQDREAFLAIGEAESDEKAICLSKKLIQKLPENNQLLLKEFLQFIQTMADYEDFNSMNLTNLTVVWAPILVVPPKNPTDTFFQIAGVGKTFLRLVELQKQIF